MSNPINLLSETCFDEKMSRQNILLAAIASQSGGIAFTSWADLQKAVRMGVAAKIFSVGDRLTCNHATYGRLIWEIIGIDHDRPTDPALTHSLTVQLAEIVTVLPFDAPEPTHSDSNRSAYGSNNWRTSSLRQWLNADGKAGEWWSAQTDTDSRPSYASTTAGFLWGMDEDFLAAVGEVEKVTARNAVTDGGGSEVNSERFFLLSSSEVYGGDEMGIAEGEPYPYYADHSELSAAGTEADANRIKYRNGTIRDWWLRTPHNSNASHVRRVFTAGELGSYAAGNNSGILPACCIV